MSTETETTDSPSVADPVPDSSKLYDGLVDYNLHVKSPPLDQSTRELIQQFRKEINQEPVYANNLYCQDYVTDTVLYAYLRARANDLKKAKALLIGTLEWRLTSKPDEIEPSYIERECELGKMVIKGLDRHNRPVWVMDSSLDTRTRNHDTAIGQLLYMLEYAKRKMSKGVEKYCLFIHLENYSMWNAPPHKTSMETLKCLTDRYPEHLGHSIMYQAPYLFQMFFNLVKPFLDAKTVSKIIFIRGDCKPGSKNDKILTNVIGENWRELANVDQPAEKKYNHKEEWPKMLEEWKQYKESKQMKQQQHEQKEIEAGNPSSDIATTTAADSAATISNNPVPNNETADDNANNEGGGVVFHDS